MTTYPKNGSTPPLGRPDSGQIRFETKAQGEVRHGRWRRLLLPLVLAMFAAPRAAPAATQTTSSLQADVTGRTIFGQANIDDNESFVIDWKLNIGTVAGVDYKIVNAENAWSPSTPTNVIVSGTSTTPSGSNSISLQELEKISPGEGDKTIWVIVKANYQVGYTYGGTTTSQEYSDSVTVRFDFTAPLAPIVTGVVAGESNLRVTWKPASENENETLRYTVEYSKAGLDAFTGAASDVTETKYVITGLDNDQAYDVRVFAADEADNVSPASEITDLARGTPRLVDDFWEQYKRAGGTETGGYCFIATAAYGSYDHASVRVLRRFRDRVLAPSAAGRFIVGAYYRLSPLLARAVAGSPWSRVLARAALEPFVWFARLADALGPGAAFAVLGLFVCAPALALSRRRRGAGRGADRRRRPTEGAER